MSYARPSSAVARPAARTDSRSAGCTRVQKRRWKCRRISGLKPKMRWASEDQPEAVRTVEIRDPTPDVADLLRLFEKGAMLFECFLGVDRSADVAEAGHDAGGGVADPERGHEPLEDAAVFQLSRCRAPGARAAPRSIRTPCCSCSTFSICARNARGCRRASLRPGHGRRRRSAGTR